MGSFNHFDALLDELFAARCERERRRTAETNVLLKSLGGTVAARRAREYRETAMRAEVARVNGALARMAQQGPPHPRPTVAERRATIRAGVADVMAKALAAVGAGRMTALEAAELEARAALVLARAAAS